MVIDNSIVVALRYTPPFLLFVVFLCFFTTFRIICSTSVKNAICVLIEIALNL